MQLDDLSANFPPLPGPPLLERYFLESPLVVVGALLIAAVAGFFILNARGKLGLGAVVAGAGVALAAGVWAMAALIVTERERLADRTRELIDATAIADTGAISPMLAERAEVIVPNLRSYETRGMILAAVEEYPGRQYPIESHSVAETRAVVDGPRTARTQVRVLHSGNAIPGASWWEIEWRRESPDEAWIVDAIRLLWLQGIGNF